MEKALELLNDSLEDHFDPEDELLQMLSRWNSAEEDASLQLIAREAMEVQKANITRSFLVFINNLKIKLTEVVEVVEEIIISDPPIFEGQHQVLLLYAKEDVIWLEKLNKHLFMLKRQTNLRFIDIHDDLPKTLQEVTAYQEKLIDVAHKVLCLVTPNSLSFSVYPLAEKAAESNKLIPLKIETVDIVDTIFYAIQGLPSNQEFASVWLDENDALVDIAMHLRQFFKNK